MSEEKPKQHKHDHSYYGVVTEPWTPAGNMNVMRDTDGMSSDQATAARARTAEIMATLKKGEPGDADKLMGDRDYKGTGLWPGKSVVQKLFSKKSDKSNDKPTQ